MRNANDILDLYYLEMRWRCLSLAADLDRVERAPGGAETLRSDPRIANLLKAVHVLLEGHGNRAEQVQNLLSDVTPPPPYRTKNSAEARS